MDTSSSAVRSPALTTCRRKHEGLRFGHMSARPEDTDAVGPPDLLAQCRSGLAAVTSRRRLGRRRSHFTGRARRVSKRCLKGVIGHHRLALTAGWARTLIGDTSSPDPRPKTWNTWRPSL